MLFYGSENNSSSLMQMNPSNHLTACPACDLLMETISIKQGEKAVCPRCETLLRQAKTHSITKVLAITSSALIAYIPAIFTPLLTLKTMGLAQSGSIFDTFLSFYHQKYYFVAVLVFVTSIFFPLLKLSLLFFVSLQLKIGVYSRSLPLLFRISHYLDEWGMPDVYLIAVCVSIIKVSNLATVEYNIGLFCFIFLVFMTRASVSALDTHLFWNTIENMKKKLRHIKK